MNGVYEDILNHFRTIRNVDSDKIDDVGSRVLLPIFEPNILIELVSDAIKLLKRQPVLVEINSPVVIVGDLHGSLHDLLRILKICGNPPTTRYLFLGDYIDRGPLSLEVITLLVSLYCSYPNHIILLRGNHELKSTACKYGFKNEIEMVYSDLAVFDSFHELFSYMPIAAVLFKEIFCVHGGISPILYNLNQITSIQKPILDEKLDLVNHLLWADPSKTFNDFSISERGKGITFGEVALVNFFAYSGMKKIIRGHQCVNGFDYSLNDRCITVFSSCDYNSKSPNSSGFIVVSNEAIEPKSLPPIKKLERKDYKFFKYTDVSVKKPLNLQREKNLSFYTSPQPRQKPKITKPQTRRSWSLNNVIPSVL